MIILVAPNSRIGCLSAPAFAGMAGREAATAFDGLCSIMDKTMEREFAMKNAQKLLFDLNLRFKKN